MAARAAATDGETVLVDKVPEVDDFRSGQVSEDELTLARSVAKRMGWTPREDWKRDPARWVDAPEFLENTPRELETVKERLKRTSQAAEAVIEDERRRAREQALAEVRAAAEKGDPDAAEAAGKRLTQTETPSQVRDWVRDNPWFEDDPDAADFARSVTNRMAAQNRPIAEQLEAAREAVKRRFPEHFGQAERREEPNTETRLSDVRRPPPMANGSRGPSGAPKERGWGDIPPGDRTSASRFVKAYQTRGLSEADAQARYARSYWVDK